MGTVLWPTGTYGGIDENENPCHYATIPPEQQADYTNERKVHLNFNSGVKPSVDSNTENSLTWLATDNFGVGKKASGRQFKEHTCSHQFSDPFDEGWQNFTILAAQDIDSWTGVDCMECMGYWTDNEIECDNLWEYLWSPAASQAFVNWLQGIGDWTGFEDPPHGTYKTIAKLNTTWSSSGWLIYIPMAPLMKFVLGQSSQLFTISMTLGFWMTCTYLRSRSSLFNLDSIDWAACYVVIDTTMEFQQSGAHNTLSIHHKDRHYQKTTGPPAPSNYTTQPTAIQVTQPQYTSPTQLKDTIKAINTHILVITETHSTEQAHYNASNLNPKYWWFMNGRKNSEGVAIGVLRSLNPTQPQTIMEGRMSKVQFTWENNTMDILRVYAPYTGHPEAVDFWDTTCTKYT
ncbi:hypothetical protein Pelo_9170 [Pelomyxa schiedti]|nr:hypothetical protein Pelo_9170 [Pelomyxa schiedti]